MDVNAVQDSSEKTCNKYVSQYVKWTLGVGVADGYFESTETVSVPLGHD